VSRYTERLPAGNCRQNARWMTLMYPELTSVEGYLVFTGPDGTERRMEHAWNQAPGGAIVDSTAWAFESETLPFHYEPDPQAWIHLRGLVEHLRGAP
jgi:hypothetical protein